MYYYHQMNTNQIASSLGYSRATVSRLLNRARDEGIVEIRINDHRSVSNDPLVYQIKKKYRSLHTVEIVSLPAESSEVIQQETLCRHAASYISNNILENNQVVGLSSGNIILLTSRYLPQRHFAGIQFVQLQGNTASGTNGPGYIGVAMRNFAESCKGNFIIFPVPALFSNLELKSMLLKEPAVQIVKDYQNRADVCIFSIDVAHVQWKHVLENAGLNRHVYENLDRDIVGEIATVSYRSDGSCSDLDINRFSSGPDLQLLRHVKRSVCISYGQEKTEATHAALRAGYISHLIVDNRLASALLDFRF